MKSILALITLTLSFSVFATTFEADELVYCRAIKPNEFFRSFQFLLRKTNSGVKMVQNSVHYAPASAPNFYALMLNPQIDSSDVRLTIVAGDQAIEADINISLIPMTQFWSGRVRVSEKLATSTFKTKVICEKSLQYSNDEPVIP